MNFTLDLGGDWTQWKLWADARVISNKGMAELALKRDKFPDPIVKEFVTNATKPLPVMDMHAYLRKLPDASAQVLAKHQVVSDLITSEFGTNAGDLLRDLNMEIAKETLTKNLEEGLEVTDKKGIFVEKPFVVDSRFDVALRRDAIEVTVGVNTQPAAGDARAASLLPAARTEWLKRIMGAWDGHFNMKNTEREIPVRFKVSLTGGPNRAGRQAKGPERGCERGADPRVRPHHRQLG
jgi:hypothetical protein